MNKELQQNTVKDTYLQEIFAPPLGLELYGSYCDLDVYSNDYIQKKFLKLLTRTNLFRSQSEVLEKLIFNRKLVLGYCASSLLSYLWKKFKSSFLAFGDRDLKVVKKDEALGFFCTRNATICIILDSNTSYGFGSDSDIYFVFCHELTHALLSLDDSLFKTLYMNSLVRFYSTLLKNLDEEKSIVWDSKTTKSISDHVSRLIDFEKSISNNNDTKVLLMWYNLITDLVTDKKKAAELMFYLIVPLFNLKELFEIDLFQNVYVDRSQIVKSSVAYFRAYKTVFNIKFRTYYGQELFFPSEVIAGLNTYNPDDKILASLVLLENYHRL